MSKRRKRRAKASRAKAQRPLSPHLRRLARGRRREETGPTPQTVAKLQPDVLLTLVQANRLTPEQASAGREIMDAWDLWRVLGGGAQGSIMGNVLPNGRAHGESGRSVWLQAVWRRWANECFKRLHVRCFVLPEILTGDRPLAGAEGLVKAGADWWARAAEQTARANRIMDRRTAHGGVGSIQAAAC